MKKTTNKVFLSLALLSLVLLLRAAVCSDESFATLRHLAAGQSVSSETTTADKLTSNFASLQDYWRQQFMDNDDAYTDARLILFREAVASPCGNDLHGPFYCPLDRSVYLDLGRYGSLLDQSIQRDDTHLMFVLAHEVGHHVQALRGVEAETARRTLQQPGIAEVLAYELELQADCIAGISWRVLESETSTETLMRAYFDSDESNRDSLERVRAHLRAPCAVLTKSTHRYRGRSIAENRRWGRSCARQK